MGKGASRLAAARLGRRSPVNTGASWPTPEEAEARVLHHQRKLHKWATTDNDSGVLPGQVASYAKTTGWNTSSFMTTRVAPAPSRSGRRAPGLVEVLAALRVGERPRDVLPSDPKEGVDVEGPDPNDAVARGGELRTVRAEGNVTDSAVARQNQMLCPGVGLEQANRAIAAGGGHGEPSGRKTTS